MLQKNMERPRLYLVHDENPASENVSSHVSLVLKKKDSQSLFVILFVLGPKPRLLQIATANHFHQILQVTFCIDWIIIHFLIRYLIALFLFLHGLLSLPKFFQTVINYLLLKVTMHMILFRKTCPLGCTCFSTSLFTYLHCLGILKFRLN